MNISPTDINRCTLCKCQFVGNSYFLQENTVFLQTDFFFIIPASHALMGGHLLIVPNTHVHSLSKLPKHHLTELEAIEGHTRNVLRRHYGSAISIGYLTPPSNIFKCKPGKHAHLAVLPILDISPPLATQTTLKLSQLHTSPKLDDGALYIRNNCDTAYIYPQGLPFPLPILQKKIENKLQDTQKQFEFYKNNILSTIDITSDSFFNFPARDVHSKTLDDDTDVYNTTLKFYEDPVEIDIYTTCANTGRSHTLRKAVSVFLSSLEKKARVLDVGCGLGHDVGAALRMGFIAFGIDNSHEMVRRAQATYGQHFALCDGRCILTQGSNAWDAIICNAVLLHIARNDAPKFLSTIYHALSPNGHLLLTTKMGYGQAWDIRKKGMRQRPNVFYSHTEIETILSDIGFTLRRKLPYIEEDGTPWIIVFASKQTHPTI